VNTTDDFFLGGGGGVHKYYNKLLGHRGINS
jgi:hypothetical protein